MPHSLRIELLNFRLGRKLGGHPAQMLPKCQLESSAGSMTADIQPWHRAFQGSGAHGFPASLLLSESFKGAKLILLRRQTLILVPCFFCSQYPLKKCRITQIFFFLKENLSMITTRPSYSFSRVRKDQLGISNQPLPFGPHSLDQSLEYCFCFSL